MMKLKLVIISLLFTVTGIAQKDSVRKYLDGNLRFTNKRNAVYAAMAIRNNDHWTLFAVYPDTTMLLKLSFKDAALTMKDGPFILYFRKKVISQSGAFKDNLPQGLWQSWYSNGQLKNAGTIIHNQFAGVWKTWNDKGQLISEVSYAHPDSINGQPVLNTAGDNKNSGLLEDFEPAGVLQGLSTTWYQNGNKEALLNYRNDSLAGVCSWFRENGSPSSKETYVNGKVTELECYNEEGKYSGATCSILKLPLLIHPFFSATDYIVYELHKEKNKDIKNEGEAEVNFTVTKKGAIEKLVVSNSPDEALTMHIARIFAAMPAWSPAVVHNRAVDYPVKLMVPYYRD
ncbi:MAG: hypothetical protein ABIQ88_00720 [Chitinophagaceae bacterium]